MIYYYIVYIKFKPIMFLWLKKKKNKQIKNVSILFCLVYKCFIMKSLKLKPETTVMGKYPFAILFNKPMLLWSQ